VNNVKRTVKRDWVLNEGALNKLLESMDADPQRAGEQYEHLRRSLIKYFDWRGSQQSEIDADKTIDRLARKLFEGEAFEDLYCYALGVARLVALESFRAQEKSQKIVEELSLLTNDVEQVEKPAKRNDCFDACLENLPANNRELIVQYYQGDKGTKIDNRQRLAHQFGMPVGRLRIQAHRIREKLEACIQGCLASAPEIDA
jgi:DNA-directed RNA polymerase specialized sigma24 family protein